MTVLFTIRCRACHREWATEVDAANAAEVVTARAAGKLTADEHRATCSGSDAEVVEFWPGVVPPGKVPPA